MPLFGNRKSVDSAVPPPEPAPVESHPRRSGTLFGRRRSVSPASTSRTSTTSSTAGSQHKRNILHRHEPADPSIIAARERVLSAEAAEQEADRALMMARTAVKEAREHVKRLEREAAEEARLAKIKQREAANISKRAKPLGRHDHI